MERNFKIEKEIELHVGEDWYDLKNDYFLSGLWVDATTGDVQIIFENQAKLGSPDSSGRRVAVVFSDVLHFEISESFVPRINTELLRIGFKDRSDGDIDWLLREEQCKKDDHLLFCLGNDEHVRIFARKAVFKMLDSST